MHGTPPCPDARALGSLLLGELSDEETATLEEHVAVCPRCLAVVRGLDSDDALVQAVRTAGKTKDDSRDALNDNLIRRLCRLRPEEIATPSSLATPPSGLAEEEGEDIARLLAPPQAPGELGRVGPYSIQRLLGRGGMGIVFAARQARPQRLVALKMILAGGHLDRQRLERFRKESEIVAQLRHRNIIAVHEVGEHEGRPYFTMDHADGGSLAQKLATAPLAPRAAAELILALAGAIDSAHARGFLHRDLKPSNILLDGDGTPRISDFGLAKQFQVEGGAAPAGQTETGAILGTPNYMAPEQAGNNKNIGPAADIYALGAILYECLTGRPPFRAATVLETLDQLRTQDPVPPSRLQPGVPRDLQTICLKCLAKGPERRYASARELADDLGRVLRGEPIRARPVSPWERAWKWTRRQPALAALIAVSALSLSGFVLAILVYNARLQAAVTVAQEQQERADAGYREARETLNRMLARLEDRRLGEVPRLKELQRALLEDALRFYQATLQGQDSPGPQVQLDTAEATRRAAAIQMALGQYAAAEETIHHALGLIESLPREPQDATATQGLLASCYKTLGLIANNRARWDDAERYQHLALEVHERLSRGAPDAEQWQSELAGDEHNLGVACYFTQRWPEAEGHYNRAIAIWDRLVLDHPKEERYQLARADTYLNLGNVWQDTGAVDKAVKAFKKVEDVLQQATRQRPPQGRIALTLAGAYVNWGEALRASQQAEMALARHSAAVELAEAVFRQEPQYNEARARVWQARGTRAQTYEALHRYSDAVKEWDRAVELDIDPNPWVRRAFRAMALARAAEHARASAEVAILAGDAAVSADGLYSLACTSALCISAAQADKRLAPARREDLARGHASQAIALLRRLQAQGWFRDAEHAKALREDTDLDSLRHRDDFRQLLSEIETGKQR
jgi:serine/threonine-protein kinase